MKEGGEKGAPANSGKTFISAKYFIIVAAFQQSENKEL